jgi:YVTN family beta-propeller protein
MLVRVPVRTLRRFATRIFACTVVLLAAFAASALFLRAEMAPTTLSPGSLADGSVLLSNGWRLAPAGNLLTVGDLPLNLALSRDGKSIVVTNAGLAQPSFTVVDVASWSVRQTVNLGQAWYGLAWHPTQSKLFLAGAAGGNVREWGVATDGTISPLRTFTRPSTSSGNFSAGIVVSPDGQKLYVTDLFLQTLSAFDVNTGVLQSTITLPAEPYSVITSSDGGTIYVSLWGGSRVQVYDARSMRLTQELGTNERPNALALSNDGKRLFVACGGDSSVWVFDTNTASAIEQISTALYPLAPKTSTPNALGLSPDGNTLLVANADNNAVAVVDVSNPARSLVNGFIPTSWYPTGVSFSRDGRQIFILSGKGKAPAADRTNTQEASRLQGSVAQLNTPDRTTLAGYTRTVYSVTPYTDKTRLHPFNAQIGSPIPASVGGSSPIKHVIYVIRENRTYDQIFGDMKQGNGDPTLTMFGAGTTPNAHSIAGNFVLFDNFYVDAEVSYDGHAFSTAAYANDFIQKIWQTYYGARGARYLGEGGGILRNPYGNISAPSGGYIWDHARRAHVGVRSYGEFADNAKNGADVTASAAVPGLADAVAPKFPAFDVSITDQRRADAWQAEFQTYAANGQLPQLSIVHLGNDHTAGTAPGAPTPRAMVGENDFALGRLVEAVSGSVYWKDTAIFVLEDDSQNGPDHVDSHRSVLLVASPYTKRGAVDHTFYTTSGVLRTMELILGLEPMSQYDAAATPLYNAFTPSANLGAYAKIQPNLAFDEKNAASAFGAATSLQMNFSAADLTPEQPLNEILWRSVKGDRPMPPPRRSAFVQPRN